ncbi:MAG: hypothetical protein AAB817_02975 [Patescibacteria group bacterium]
MEEIVPGQGMEELVYPIQLAALLFITPAEAVEAKLMERLLVLEVTVEAELRCSMQPEEMEQLIPVAVGPVELTMQEFTPMGATADLGLS